jgi:hypothetical protein
VAIRELGGVVGVSVIAGIFTAHGATTSSGEFLAGARPALLAASLAVAISLLAALALPRRGRAIAASVPTPLPEAAPS